MKCFRIIAIWALLVSVGLNAVSAQAGSPEASPAPVKSTYMGGNASDLVPFGSPQEVDVVTGGGPYELTSGGSGIALVVRNLTLRTVESITVSVAIRTSDGQLFAAAESREFAPYRVPPGELAIGVVVFEDMLIPEDTTPEFVVSWDQAGENSYTSYAELVISEETYVEDRVIGMVTNVGTEESSYPMFRVSCLSPDTGRVTGWVTTNDTIRDIDPDETKPFQADSFENCEHFLIAAM